MNYSKQFYSFLTIATNAETAEEQKAALKKAEAELSKDEYKALLRVLRDTGLLMH